MKKRINGVDYLYLALCAFAGLSLELILVSIIEPIFGISIETYTTAQIIGHWIVTCLIWLLVGLVLIRLEKKKYGFNLWETHNELKAWQYLGIIVCLVLSIVTHYIDWGGFKPLIEFQNLGPLKFIFQYTYYFFETFLISLIIIYGQMACERWFKNEHIPYGGIVLSLTWGLIHIFSKGSVSIGLISAFGGFFFGAAYLIVGKDYKKTLSLLFLMFIL